MVLMDLRIGLEDPITRFMETKILFGVLSMKLVVKAIRLREKEI